jgi:Uma2 family endonuclease
MKFSDLDLSQEYSYADYLKWTFEDRLEIIKGKIFKMSGPNRWHQKLSAELSWRLFSYLRGKTCEVYTAPFDVRLPQKSKRNKDIYTVVQPDLFVVCDQSKLDRKGCVGAPDIVIEILPPGNNRKELFDKYKVYEESGVKEYWVFQYGEPFCNQHTHNYKGCFRATRQLTTADILTTPILPGFELDLAEIFSGAAAAAA